VAKKLIPLAIFAALLLALNFISNSRSPAAKDERIFTSKTLDAASRKSGAQNSKSVHSHVYGRRANTIRGCNISQVFQGDRDETNKKCEIMKDYEEYTFMEVAIEAAKELINRCESNKDLEFLLVAADYETCGSTLKIYRSRKYSFSVMPTLIAELMRENRETHARLVFELVDRLTPRDLAALIEKCARKLEGKIDLLSMMAPNIGDGYIK